MNTLKKITALADRVLLTVQIKPEPYPSVWEAGWGEQGSLEEWQSEVRASVTLGGKQISESAYLSASYAESAPELRDNEINGYLPDMIVEALVGLREQVAKQHPNATDVLAEIDRLLAALN